MTFLSKGVVFALTVVTICSTASQSSAYTRTSHGWCSGYEEWEAPGHYPVLEMCYNFSSGQSPPASRTQLRIGRNSAYWMWVREALGDTVLYVNQSSCASDGRTTSNGNWFKNNNLSKVWYDVGANFTWSGCNSSTTIGCEHTDRNICVHPGQRPWIRDTNVAIREDWGSWIDENTNTLAECLSSGISPEDAFIHEVGHSYGLGHMNAFQAAMNGTINRRRVCNVGAGYRPQPLSDDVQGYLSMYKSYSGNRYNVAGTAFYRNGSGNQTIHRTNFMTIYGSLNVSVPFTYMNYYDEPSEIRFRIRILPAWDSSPTPGEALWSSGSWTVSPKHPGAIYPVTVSTTIPWNVGSIGASYRLWIQMDPYSNLAETDEGDNWIPTDVTFVRG